MGNINLHRVLLLVVWAKAKESALEKFFWWS